jgi:hypothetical protein
VTGTKNTEEDNVLEMKTAVASNPSELNPNLENRPRAVDVMLIEAVGE